MGGGFRRVVGWAGKEDFSSYSLVIGWDAASTVYHLYSTCSGRGFLDVASPTVLLRVHTVLVNLPVQSYKSVQ